MIKTGFQLVGPSPYLFCLGLYLSREVIENLPLSLFLSHYRLVLADA